MNGFAVRADGRGCRAVDSVDQLLDGEIFSAEYPTLAVASADVLMLIANERFKREGAGIVVQGLAIQTDRSSQAKLTRAAVRASRDISYLIHWKQENVRAPLLNGVRHCAESYGRPTSLQHLGFIHAGIDRGDQLALADKTGLNIGIDSAIAGLHLIRIELFKGA
ncbi:hypothetical protein AB9H16_30500, partial [Pseudomonas protegens]